MKPFDERNFRPTRREYRKAFPLPKRPGIWAWIMKWWKR